MSHTPLSRTALLAAIKLNPTAAALRMAGEGFLLLAWCNNASLAAAWRTAVPPSDSDEAATYTAYNNMTAGTRDSWSLFLKFSRDLSKVKIRAWVIDIWGNATPGSITEAILQAGVEFATNAQAALGSTPATSGTVTAVVRNYDGRVNADDVAWMIGQV